MGIWIRSQDLGCLVCCTALSCIPTSQGGKLVGWHEGTGEEDFFILGTYPTEAQARGVLDEIEAWLSQPIPIEHMPLSNNYFQHNIGVYHMSPAKEVTP